MIIKSMFVVSDTCGDEQRAGSFYEAVQRQNGGVRREY